MNKNAFVNGMLFNMTLIFAGVIFLLWMSTFSNNDIAAKMQFYGTSAGKFVAMFLFILPFILVLQRISQRDLTIKGLVVWVTGMILAQIVIAAYVPLIVDLYGSAGTDIGDILIRSKG